MKGTVLKCLGELVKERFGVATWERILERAGMSRSTFFSPMDDIEDRATFAVIGAAQKELGLTQAQAFDAFAEYWMSTYGPRVYPVYYEGIGSSREFITKLDAIHDRVTRNIKNAKPPRFEYRWLDERRLVMVYHSKRGLIDLMVSMARAVGKHFGEALVVRKLSPKELEITFPLTASLAVSPT